MRSVKARKKLRNLGARGGFISAYCVYFMKFRTLFVPCLFSLFCGTASADVKLPQIFGDHMVLQRETGVPFWGWAEPGEKVAVRVGSVTASTTAGQDGKWNVKVNKLVSSNTPVEVRVEGKNKIVLQDVLIGDVWVCSGQSNMEFGVTGEISATEDLPKAAQPQIRFFYVPMAIAPSPAKDVLKVAPTTGHKAGWQVCTPENLTKAAPWMGFSAVGYHFGKDIHAATGKPVGLIGAYWGGSPAQTWMSLEAVQAVPELKVYADEGVESTAALKKFLETRNTELLSKWNTAMDQWITANQAAMEAYLAASQKWVAAAKEAMAAEKALPAQPKPEATKAPRLDSGKNQGLPGGCFNAMIAPLIPYAIKGAIWYQGEANARTQNEAALYRTLFSSLIKDWRIRWGQGDFPFLFVQLANFVPSKNEQPDSWPVLRESQAQTLALPNTGMAITVDIGEATDIHPKDKWDVAQRLALAARHVAYGEEVDFSGPIYKGMKVEGKGIRVQFEHAGGGLRIGVPPEHFHPGEQRAPSTELLGFSIAGADGKFVWAKAKIDGESVIVSSEAVPNPIAVRYAWADCPIANLYNNAGLPASPFRTESSSTK